LHRYTLSRPAKADFDEIWLDLAIRANIDIAGRITDEITDQFGLLAAMPEVGRARPELGPAGLRSFVVDDYVIYYRKAKRGGIQVARIIHGKRDQGKALGR
jgi:plasmid stabilization system protein ParE